VEAEAFDPAARGQLAPSRAPTLLVVEVDAPGPRVDHGRARAVALGVVEVDALGRARRRRGEEGQGQDARDQACPRDTIRVHRRSFCWATPPRTTSEASVCGGYVNSVVTGTRKAFARLSRISKDTPRRPRSIIVT